MCGLNSVTAECTSFSASNCTCNLGYQSKDELVCESECKVMECSIKVLILHLKILMSVNKEFAVRMPHVWTCLVVSSVSVRKDSMEMDSLVMVNSVYVNLSANTVKLDLRVLGGSLLCGWSTVEGHGSNREGKVFLS